MLPAPNSAPDSFAPIHCNFPEEAALEAVEVETAAADEADAEVAGLEELDEDTTATWVLDGATAELLTIELDTDTP
jgi:hypothetical protein